MPSYGLPAPCVPASPQVSADRASGRPPRRNLNGSRLDIRTRGAARRASKAVPPTFASTTREAIEIFRKERALPAKQGRVRRSSSPHAIITQPSMHGTAKSPARLRGRRQPSAPPKSQRRTLETSPMTHTRLSTHCYPGSTKEGCFLAMVAALRRSWRSTYC